MFSNTEIPRFHLVLLLASLGWAGCSSSTPASGIPSDASQGSGGSGTGGAVTTGGTVTTGGVVTSGGAITTGGSVNSGGALTTGGAKTTGGTVTTGGEVTAGGAVTTGGAKSTGGAITTGGAVTTGGAISTGGAVITGGAKGTGGASGSGGATTIRDGGTGAGVDAIVMGTDATYPVSTGTPTVYVAGDSTVSTYTAAQAPQEGWGQEIQKFFTSDVVIVNKAIGGESSKSFADQGHLAEILAVIKPGDYLFAQWGINDRSVAGPDRATDPATTFRTYLKQYIDGARGKNAIPVLITPTPRLQYSNGVFSNGFQAYCDAIKAVGTETNTPVIDLQSMGLAYYTVLGYATVSTTISLNKGTPDVLHFQTHGAYEMARLVATGVQALNLPISKSVIQSQLDGG